jgi:integrase
VIVKPKKDNKGRYFIRVYKGVGNRPYKLLEEEAGTLTYQEAKKQAETWYASLSSETLTTDTRLTLSAIFKLYLRGKSTSMSQQSKSTTLLYSKKFIDYFGDIAVETLTPRSIEGYKEKRIADRAGKATPANATINREISILKAAISECHRQGDIPYNPLPSRSVKRLPNHMNTDYFQREEFEAFINVFSQTELILEDVKQNHKIYNSATFKEEYLFNMERAADIFRILLLTNSRLGEILNLKWQAVSLKTKKIVITQFKTASKKYQDIPDELFSILQRLQKSTPDNGGFVLTRYDKKPFSTDQVERSFKKGLLLSHINRHLTPHALRHTASSWMVAAGVSLYTVGATAGHKNIASTQRYAHLAPSTLTVALTLLSSPAKEISATNGKEDISKIDLTSLNGVA